MDKQKTDPAFPCLPMNDNFGRMIVPVPGMSKYEFVLKDFMIGAMNFECEPDQILEISIELTNMYFKHLNNNNESEQSTESIFAIK
jgi:hypothetical protein